MIMHEEVGPVPTTLSRAEFDFECAQMVREMRMGIDHSIEEISERLGIDVPDLMIITAAHVVRETGRPVVLVPVPPKEEMQ